MGNINIQLLKKFGHYENALYEIRRGFYFEGDFSGTCWFKCRECDCQNLTQEELEYIKDNYGGFKNGMFELEIHWSLTME